MGRYLFGITVFLSAFLLFQVQPVLGKYILPWFGSAPGVWAVCLVFFQVVLLGGYAYAHLVVSRLQPRTQALVHVTLLGVALLTLPITPDATWKPEPGDAPAARILLVLATSVGLPYLLLSATGPLLQGWFTRAHPKRSVYRLYALSNLGSLLGLLTYPLWFERVFRLDLQTSVWSIAYGAFALACAACAWMFVRQVSPSASRNERMLLARPAWADVALWFLLPGCASALLLATTNQLCLDVAVVPFLWVVPLCVYLVSFILTFDHERWYARPLFVALLPIAIGAAVWLTELGVDGALYHQLIGYPAVLFVLCMCCHGELARIKPPPRQLTLFFLIVSFGGAIGGMAVALGAPQVFDRFHEYPLLLIVTFGLVSAAVGRQVLRGKPDSFDWRAFLAPGGWVPKTHTRKLLGFGFWVVAGAAVVYGAWSVIRRDTWFDDDPKQRTLDEWDAWHGTLRFVMIALPVIAVITCELLRRGPVTGGRRAVLWTGAALCGLGLATAIHGAGWTMYKGQAGVLARGRNFYGVLSVREYDRDGRWHDYTLQHGRITHGFQLLRNPTWPTSYYGPTTGVGLAISLYPGRRDEGRALRIGVVGLGAGTMAAHANTDVDSVAITDASYVEVRIPPPSDYLRFYEINPMVVEFARSHFEYLSFAEKRGVDVDVYLGDARLVMERQLSDEQPERFDVLAIDAFSSDAIPIHLLTQESLRTYLGHLAPMGVIAFHVTNRYIDLIPVVRRLGAAQNLQVVHIESDAVDSRGVYACDWVLVTRNRPLYYALRSAQGANLSDEMGPLWTDDYSSVWDQVDFGDEEEEEEEEEAEEDEEDE